MHSLKYYNYRLEWFLAKWFVPKRPIHLDIEITSACNLKCGFCPHSEKEKDFKIGHMDFDMFREIVDEAVKIGIPSIKLNLRGEPTIHPQFLDILEYVKGKFVDIRINTNGNYDNELIDMAIIDIGAKLIFSINEYSEKKLDPFSDRSLIEANVSAYYNLYHYKKIILSFVDTGLISDRVRINRYKNLFPKAKFFIRPAMERTKSKFVLGKKKAIRRKNCYMPNRRLVVATTGDIYPCCVMWHKPFITLGNFKEDMLHAVWNSYQMNVLRMHLDAMGKGKYQISPHPACKNCESSESYVWK